MTHANLLFIIMGEYQRAAIYISCVLPSKSRGGFHKVWYYVSKLSVLHICYRDEKAKRARTCACSPANKVTEIDEPRKPATLPTSNKHGKVCDHGWYKCMEDSITKRIVDQYESSDQRVDVAAWNGEDAVSDSFNLCCEISRCFFRPVIYL